MHIRTRRQRQSVGIFPTAALLLAAASTLAQAELLRPFRDFSSVHKRAVQCPSDYFSCEDQGQAFAGTCCQKGSKCSLDNNNEAACCPAQSVCTGSAPTGTTTATPSFVENSYFSFPYVPTAFPNAPACSTALSQCSNNYAACTQELGGNGARDGSYGVTVAVPGGGGTTVAPTHATVALPSATSICSSLSSVGCREFEPSQCTEGGLVGSGNAAGPRQTAACVAGVIAGVGIGLMGAVQI